MESFKNIDIWLKELKTHANPDAKVFIIGNKLDLESNRKVSKEEALRYKEEYKLDYFTECSAKSGLNAKDVFVEATKILYNDYLKYKDSVSLIYLKINYDFFNIRGLLLSCLTAQALDKRLLQKIDLIWKEILKIQLQKKRKRDVVKKIIRK